MGSRLPRLFAVFATIVMVLTAFAALPRGASASATALSPSGGPSTATAYGPGVAVTPMSSGTTNVTNLATFTRYDGVVLPYANLNVSTNQWPYLVAQNASSFTVTRGDWTFTQGKIVGAKYAFQVDRIKETLIVPSAPPVPQTKVTVAIPFTTTYSASIQGTSIDLLQGAGEVAWSTAPFEAWDAAAPAHTWSQPVTSLTWSLGVLVFTLNATMLASATYPLSIDPTWTLDGSSGWGSSAFVNATKDLGDGTVKHGTLADNFNNNLGTGWSTSGTVTFSGGSMNLGATPGRRRTGCAGTC